MLPNNQTLAYRNRSKVSKRPLNISKGLMASVLTVLSLFYWLLYRHAAATLAETTDSSVQLSANRVIQGSFYPGNPWKDTNGNLIQAHGGGILQHQGTYYWYGEDRSSPTYTPPPHPERKYTTARTDVVGVHCYSSRDLFSWRDEGLVLRAGDHPDLDPSRVLERPKVIHNNLTGLFVMWMHIDDSHYEEAKAGVAWSESPTGPFRYVGSSRPNDHMSRDMTLFKDDDQRAYLIYSSERNKVLHVAELAPDYLTVLPRYTPVAAGLSREAPAAFKHQGSYFLLTSGCTGWSPNRAEVFTAPSPSGPWASLGDPCSTGSVDMEDCRTFFSSQDTFVLAAPGVQGGRGDAGHFIVMADRWDPTDLGSSRYVWLPLWVETKTQQQHRWFGASSMQSTVQVTVRWFNRWDWSTFSGVWF